MSRLTRWLAPTTTARAHCDLPCGVYDPEQARIEAESCYRIIEKYAGQRGRRPSAPARSGSRRSAPSWSSTTSTSCGTTTSSPSTSRRCPNLHELFWNANKQASKVKASTDTADCQEAARHDRRDRRGLEGDRRPREDPRRRPTRPDRPPDAHPEAPPGGGASSYRAPRPACAARGAWRSPGEHASRRSSAGDWLLVDPTAARWPRRGTIVVFREPDGGSLAIKRVAAGPGRPRPVRATATSSSPTTRRGWSADAEPRATAAAGSRRADRLPAVRAGAARAARRPGLVPLRPAAPDRAAGTFRPWTSRTSGGRVTAPESDPGRNIRT